MIAGRVKQWWKGRAAVDDAASPLPLGSPAQLRVLMVCMGNICRSPIAEGVLRAKLQQAGLHEKVLVDSAGTHGYHTAEPPDPRAIRQAAQRGYDIAGLRARSVSADDYQRFDWLLAMDEANLAWLRKHAPAAHGSGIELLLAHNCDEKSPGQRGQPARHEVPDPYYGAPAGFDLVLDLVEAACDRWVVRLAADRSRAGVRTGLRRDPG